ncbi:hypothetical protein [Comamonas sp.]|jgi:hypothetical protein|uniref:hypothetical protein n=1 Tax=Comamonas sp. TaxID=34028 RepID=UPI0035D96D8D
MAPTQQPLVNLSGCPASPACAPARQPSQLWLRLPFWPCVAYMAVDKFLRYLVMTALTIKLW